MNTLEHIPQADLQEAWKIIRPGLEKVHKHSVSGWIPEDVYVALRAGHSTLHLAYVEGDYAGFMVLTPQGVWDGKALHIWCAYNASKHDVLSLYEADLDRMARDIGATKITFWSPRAWEKYGIAKHGFKAMQTEYVKVL